MGFIVLHRQLSEHPIWLMEPFTYGQAWADLIMLANHKDGVIKVRGIVLPIKRGQVGWSALTLSSRWKWSRGKTLRYFDYLVQQGMIIIEQQNIKLSSIITIIKYNEYQFDGTTNRTTKRTSDDTSDGHQTDTNNNGNNGNNGNKQEYTADFLTFWKEYPKKVGKGEAWKAWGKIPTETTIPVILQAIAWQKTCPDWQRDSGQYIPHPATYLNQRRWEDEPTKKSDTVEHFT